MSEIFRSDSVAMTEEYGRRLAQTLTAGDVVAFYGGMGMGKTAMVRGIADGLGLSAEVSSPTFALVHNYGGQPPLIHFDMYRVTGWDDLYSTGYFDYLDAGTILVVEWSENVWGAMEDAIVITISRLDEDTRKIEIEGGDSLADPGL